MRTSTLRQPVPPTRSISFSCSTRRILTCRPGSISPISSRKMVPPSASSKRPGRERRACVKAPFSWPKSSLSRRSRGMAPQLTGTKGLSALGLAACRARTSNSLPVPDSPVTSTVLSVGATLPRILNTPARLALCPMIPLLLSSMHILHVHGLYTVNTLTGHQFPVKKQGCIFPSARPS